MTAIRVVLFFLGLALGSFLDVLAARYESDRFLLNRRTLGGRSRCPHCGKTLQWYELVPLASFLIQRGRCRGCAARISADHFWAELASGVLVALVPFRALEAAPSGGHAALGFATLWTAAFLLLLLLSLIDLRLQLIPDEVTIALGLAGLAVTALQGAWLAHVIAAAGAAAFFGLLILVTRGRGMGMGDAKLAFALGLLFGWPATLFLVMLAFIVGAAAGLALIAAGAKRLKSAVPFGPFLALAAVIVFLWGGTFIDAYLRLLGV